MDEKHVKMIERIHAELIGDEFTDGLIPEFKSVKKRVDTHDVYFKLIIYGGSLVAFVAAFWSDIKGIWQ